MFSQLRKYSVILVVTSFALVSNAQERTPAVDTGGTQSVSTLLPQSATEAMLEVERDLRVEIIETGTNHLQLRARIGFESGQSGILKVTPDFENRTYSARIIDVSPEILDMLDVLPMAPHRIEQPQQKIFGINACTRVEAITRSHSGSADVIRGTTTSLAEWWYADTHGLECIDLYDDQVSCNPAFGMTAPQCDKTPEDDGTRTAKLITTGSYQGSPGGSFITVIDATVISIAKTNGIIAAAVSVNPMSEGSSLQLIWQAYGVTCPTWV